MAEQPGDRLFVVDDETFRAYGPPFDESDLEPILRAREEANRYRANIAVIREQLSPAARSFLVECLDHILGTARADQRHLLVCAPLAQTSDKLTQLRQDLDAR